MERGHALRDIGRGMALLCLGKSEGMEDLFSPHCRCMQMWSKDSAVFQAKCQNGEEI